MEYMACLVGARGVASTNPRREKALQGPGHNTGLKCGCAPSERPGSAAPARPELERVQLTWVLGEVLACR